MVSKTSQSQGCEPRAEFSNSLSEHPLIHTDVPTYSDEPKPLTDAAMKQSVMNS